MRVATHSVTQYQTRDEFVFDLDDYLICKNYLAPKDEQIARRCASIIAALPAASLATVRILDVGTGEGSQTERICIDLARRLRKAFRSQPMVLLDCVEPCPIAGRYLCEVATRLSALGQEFRVYPETIEEFLDKMSEEYGVVLACHSLYHFPQSSWLLLLERLMQAIAPDGILLVNLVSRESGIYRILDRLEREDRLVGVPRTLESCGHLCFSEDLEPVLESLDCLVERQQISSTITLPLPELTEVLSELDTGAAEVSRIIRFFSFMFRVTPADLLAVGRDVFRDFLVGEPKAMKFESIDYLYVLRRRP